MDTSKTTTNSGTDGTYKGGDVILNPNHKKDTINFPYLVATKVENGDVYVRLADLINVLSANNAEIDKEVLQKYFMDVMKKHINLG